MNVHESRQWWISIGVTLGLLVLTWWVGTVLAQEPVPGQAPADALRPQAELSLAATVSSTISYQGVLQEGGVPVTGDRDLTFNFYTNAGCSGVAVYSTAQNDVPLADGVFSVQLDVTQGVFWGQALWLEVEVDGVDLGCEAILPVPYAMSLRPGATIVGDTGAASGFGDAVLNVDNAMDLWGSGASSTVYARAGTGSAIRGESGGIGVYGYSEWQPAVYGEAVTSTAGYFQSGEGYGIRVNTDGEDHWDHGGYFTSNGGYGVYGVSAQNYGMYGEGAMAGVRGSGDTRGVSGSSASGYGVSGWSNSGTGVYGSSNSANGVEGFTWRSDGNYGLFTSDNLYSNNYHLAGAVMQVAQNAGKEALEPGDVVVLVGVVAPQEPGGPLVIQVAQAAEANSTAVAGVVHRRFNFAAVAEGRGREEAGVREVTLAGPVPPGAHLLLVVQGPAQVKTSALSGAIQPGDLLSTAEGVGYAARAAQVRVGGVETSIPGTVFAKALEPLEVGEDGMIYVFVTLQ